VSRKYLITIIAVACVALALAAFLEDLAAAFIAIVGPVIFWQNHKIEEAEQVARQHIPG
jgi:uncharacterized Tic20 family protein